MRLAKRRRVGPDDPMAVVTRFLDAANHHDADTLYATVHPDFESFQPLHPDRNFRGPGQLISNWKAIFEAEPGFRLTVLRASSTGNTVWVEIHGAGEDAEAAGIFIVGVQNGRIRWVRVYSDLVDGVAVEEPPPVPTPIEQTGDTGGDGAEVVGSGALRLVDNPDERGPEPVPGTDGEDATDSGLRLVEPAAPATTNADEKAEPDIGPVETLVGPSRVATPAPAAGDSAALTPDDDLWLPDWTQERPAGGDDPIDLSLETTDSDEAGAGADTVVGDLAVEGSEGPAAAGATDDRDDQDRPDDDETEPAADDDVAEPDGADEPEPFDTGLPPEEPRRSRWRKALRKL